MITYYDSISGQQRIKPRYKFALVALCLGFAVGMLAARLL